MIISKRLIATIKNVVSNAQDKEDKLKELRLITGSNIKTNNHLLYHSITNKHLNIEDSQKLIDWFESYTYEIPLNEKQYSVASGLINGVQRCSIIQYRVVDVFFSNLLDNVEFDNMENVAISEVVLDEN